MRVINPRDESVKHISEVTKTQLAKAVNEQTETIKKQQASIKAMAKLLLALALEPDAFKYGDGRATIDVLALDKVQFGSQLKLEYTDTLVILGCVAPTEAPVIAAPRFVGLN